MMRVLTKRSSFGGILTILSFISLVFFPWLFTIALVLGSALFVPLLPLAIGLCADALYYAPHANVLPIFTLWGVVITAAALFVQKRLRTQ